MEASKVVELTATAVVAIYLAYQKLDQRRVARKVREAEERYEKEREKELEFGLPPNPTRCKAHEDSIARICSDVTHLLVAQAQANGRIDVVLAKVEAIEARLKDV